MLEDFVDANALLFPSDRESWLANTGVIKYIHRTFSWAYTRYVWFYII